MDRKLPPQYEGWQQHQPSLRRLATPDLITEVQDGSPDRRLAALSLIDLSEVSPAQIEDWIRVLPDAEANELAGAIPAPTTRSTSENLLRWLDVACNGYERRRLPTFLVRLMSSLEALDARDCPGAPAAWERTGAWLGEVYDAASAARDHKALGDLSLFVFEVYLDREPIFEAFCGLMSRHRELASRVSANPGLLLSGLPTDSQRHALREGQKAGGLPLKESWAALHGLG